MGGDEGCWKGKSNGSFDEDLWLIDGYCYSGVTRTPFWYLNTSSCSFSQFIGMVSLYNMVKVRGGLKSPSSYIMQLQFRSLNPWLQQHLHKHPPALSLEVPQHQRYDSLFLVASYRGSGNSSGQHLSLNLIIRSLFFVLRSSTVPYRATSSGRLRTYLSAYIVCNLLA